ncbi:MAG: XkdX family protein [Eggerthellaceae bacterium]|nr:XkdX family protein [Eggerthellaceae bacterium]
MAVNVYEKAAQYYAKGLWKLAQLEALVAKGLLTEEQVRQIVGIDGEFDGMTASEVLAALGSNPTKARLQDACDALGIEYAASATKAQLLALIEAEVGAE